MWPDDSSLILRICEALSDLRVTEYKIEQMKEERLLRNTLSERAYKIENPDERIGYLRALKDMI